MLNRSAIKPVAQGQRTYNRLRLVMPGELELTGGTQGCFIDNVSSSGARIRVAQPLQRGCPAVLHLAERRAFATVVWVHGNQCGLRFDKNLPLEEMQRLLWITQNREQYDRERQLQAAKEWSVGQQAPAVLAAPSGNGDQPRGLPPIPRV